MAPTDRDALKPSVHEDLAQLLATEQPDVRPSLGRRVLDVRQDIVKGLVQKAKRQSPAQHELCVEEGLAAVQPPDEQPARTQYAPDFPKRPLRGRDVVQHAEGVHDIEAVVGERELLGVHHLQVGLQLLLLTPLGGQLDAARREVDATEVGPRAAEPQMVGTEADADLEHPQALKSLPSERLVHPRLHALPVCLHACEGLRAAELFVVGCQPARGVVSPLRSRLLADVIGPAVIYGVVLINGVAHGRQSGTELPLGEMLVAVTKLSVKLYVNAVRSMQLRQMLYRSRRLLSPRIIAAGTRERDPSAWRPLARGLAVDRAPQSGPVPAPEGEGVFVAVGHQRVFMDTPSFWAPGSDGLMFAFHLHGFSELARYAEADAQRDADEFWVKVINSWLTHAGRPSRPGWHPYPMSARVMAWTAALSRGGWPQELQGRMLRSLSRQAAILKRSVEHDIGGNHVLRNATALVFAGICLGDVRLERRGLSLLRAHVACQVLPDGGHEERSTSYHRSVHADLSDVERLLRHAGRSVPVWLQNARVRMQSWEDTMRGPDGALPLLNDAWEGPSVRRASRPDVCVLRSSGYVVLRAADDQAILDVGRLAPSHLPPHAHADLLSFVLWADGRPVVVDPGSFTYTGPGRSDFRSTAAHNTVEIDGRDQCEFWGDFRAAFMPTVTHLDVQVRGDITVVTARHDGYRRLDDPVMHERTFVWLPGAGLVVIDRLHAKRPHRAASRLHLAHGIVGTAMVAGSLELTPLGPAVAATVRAGRYSPYLGQAQRIDVIEYALMARPLTPFGWALLRHGTTVAMEGDALAVTGPRAVALRLGF
jgi:Heparinase II/III-like protein/Heparinase II/III N-terminus